MQHRRQGFNKKSITDQTMEERKIIHIDMDAFFAAVEQRDNPELGANR